MTDVRKCQNCGREYGSGSPEGLCPNCLLRAGIAKHSLAEDDLQRTAPISPESRFAPPSIQEMAGAFPQLEIIELIGAGGMGAVYKARQIGLDRLVALKILPKEFGYDPAFSERFNREARALAKLNHPHIVGVYDFGQVGGQFYFVMEYVDGANLRDAMLHGKIESAQALAIVPQICDALQYAHDNGIVHRDIKPENILLNRRGHVKIADFGLSKLVTGPESGVVPTALTGTHQVMGTVRYMAPEQMEGSRTVDHRADIYALGVVFYEMLTGELPLGRFSKPSEKVQIDVRLDEVVLRSLEKEPARRYQQASQIKLDTESIVNSTMSVPESTTGAPPRGSLVGLFALVAFIAILAAVGGMYLGRFEVTILSSVFIFCVIWLWALVDCLRFEPSHSSERLVWILLVIFLGPVGGTLYLVIRRPQRIRESHQAFHADNRFGKPVVASPAAVGIRNVVVGCLLALALVVVATAGIAMVVWSSSSRSAESNQIDKLADRSSGQPILYTFSGPTKFAEGPDGPILSDRAVEELGIGELQRKAVDEIISRYYKEFVSLERQHTKFERNAEGRIVVNISPFGDETVALAKRLVAEVRGTINRELFDPDLPGNLENFGLFRHAGRTHVAAQLWKENDLYQFSESIDAYSYPGFSTEGVNRGNKGPDWHTVFPREYWIYWTE